MIKYYIYSNKYSIHERKTKLYGLVYDIYFYIIELDGTQKQKKLSGYKTKALAKQAYLEFINEFCEPIKFGVKVQSRVKKQDLTIEQLFPLYMASIINQNKDSVIYERTHSFKKNLMPYFKDFTLKQMTTEALYCWQDKLWATKNPKTNQFYSFNYLSKIRTMLSAFLTWCETRYGNPNNLLKVKMPKRRSPKKEMQIWKQEDFFNFIKAIDFDIKKLTDKLKTDKANKLIKEQLNKLMNYRMFFYIAFYTGRRKGEILALNIEDVKLNSIKFTKSLTRKTIGKETYKVTSSKTEKQESSPICPALAKELKKFKGQSPFFLGGEKPIHENTLARIFKYYTELSGNKAIRIHDLRHSFVSMMIHLGAPLTVCASLIGDTLTQVTETYAHLYTEDKEKYLNKLI